MIRTEIIQLKFPQAGWLGSKIKSVIVSRIKREKNPQGKKLPSQAQMEALRKKFEKV